MPLIVKDNFKAFLPCPEGLTQAVCVDVVDLGMKDTQNGLKHKIRVVWMTEHINPETQRPFEVGKHYTASLNDKAFLCMDLQTWRGRKFTAEEKQEFDLEKLLGANCQVQIVHELVDNTTWANVQAVVPIGASMTKMRIPDGYVRRKDRPKDGQKEAQHGNPSPTQAGF